MSHLYVFGTWNRIADRKDSGEKEMTYTKVQYSECTECCATYFGENSVNQLMQHFKDDHAMLDLTGFKCNECGHIFEEEEAAKDCIFCKRASDQKVWASHSRWWRLWNRMIREELKLTLILFSCLLSVSLAIVALLANNPFLSMTILIVWVIILLGLASMEWVYTMFGSRGDNK